MVIPYFLVHGPLLKASPKVCLSDEKMDIAVVWRQEQEGGPVISSLPATGHILEWPSPTLTSWLEPPLWLPQLSTPGAAGVKSQTSLSREKGRT